MTQLNTDSKHKCNRNTKSILMSHSMDLDFDRSRLLSKHPYQKFLRHLHSCQPSFGKHLCPSTTISVLSQESSESPSCCHCSPCCLQEAVHQKAGGFSLNSFKVVHSFPQRKCCIMTLTTPFCFRKMVYTHSLHHCPANAVVKDLISFRA